MTLYELEIYMRIREQEMLRNAERARLRREARTAAKCSGEGSLHRHAAATHRTRKAGAHFLARLFRSLSSSRPGKAEIEGANRMVADPNDAA